MNRVLTVIAAAALVMGACACNDNLKTGTVDLTIPEDPVEPVNASFRHPGAYVNADDIARVKAAVTTADPNDPVYASWLQFCSSPLSSATVAPNVLETVVRGDPKGTGVSSENYITCAEQAATAFQQALRWQISGDTKYAEASRSILNAWAAGCKKITSNDANQMLLAGFQGHTFANAAELLRSYEGWTASEQKKFGDWLKNIWYAKNYEFLSTHGGSNTCNLHYWSNWEFANMASMLAIGIYLEDQEMISFVNNEFMNGKGSGCVKNYVPFDPVADPSGKSAFIAQNMESGRDQGHGTLTVSISAEICRMAQNTGLDFWSAYDDRILAAYEYTAKFNVKVNGSFVTTNMPFTRYEYCTGCSCKDHNHGAVHTTVSSDGRGKERPCWDLIYAHYAKEAGYPANKTYYTKLFAEQLRYTDGKLTGDGGAGVSRYGTTSAAYDQIGWGTMLFYRGE